MFVECISQEENDRTAVRIGGIVTRAGDGELFHHGAGLYEQTRKHLPQGYFSHV